MIKIVIPSYPESDLAVEIVACDKTFLVEVISHLGLGFRIRQAGHPLEGEYELERLTDLLMDIDNGETDELLKAFGLNTRDAWERYRARVRA